MAGSQAIFAQAKEGWRARRVERARRRDAREQRAAGRRVAVCKVIAVSVVFALLLGLAFLVGDSSYHATVAGWMPPIALLVGLGLAFGYLQLVRRNLTFAEEALTTSCQRGSDVRFSVRFSNPLPVFIFKIDVHLVIADAYGNEANATTTTLTLAPYESQSFDFSMQFEHLGAYEAGLACVIISDFLGFFTATIENGKRTVVNVTPQSYPVDSVRFSNDALMEASRAAKSVLADSMDYAYAREYMAGDPLKTIHWKLSARSDHYMTRLYEQYTNPGVCIVLDFYGRGDDADLLMTMFDAVVEAGFSIADYSRSCGYETEIRFCAKDGEHRLVRRWAAVEMPEIVDDMPAMGNGVGEAAAMDVLSEQLASSRGQNNLVVCTTNLDADMVSLVLGARGSQRVPLMVAVVPAGLDGRARDEYCKPLARLDSANVPYVVIAHASELAEVGL